MRSRNQFSFAGLTAFSQIMSSEKAKSGKRASLAAETLTCFIVRFLTGPQGGSKALILLTLGACPEPNGPFCTESLPYPKNVRVERVIVTGDGLTQRAFQGASAKADLNLYTGTPASAQEFSAAKELTSPEIAQPIRQHDFGIGF